MTGLVAFLQERATHLRNGLLLAVVDLFLVAMSFAAMLLVRQGADVPQSAWDGYVRFVPVAAAVVLLANALCGLYGRVWRYAGIDEARRVLLAGLLATAVLAALVEPRVPKLGWTVVLGGSFLMTMLVGTTRFQARLFAFRRRSETVGVRVVVLGAGDTGAMLVRQMKDAPRLGLVPVAVLDDDPARQGRTLHGVRVAGGFDVLPDVARLLDAQQAVLAVPSASQAVVRRVTDLADAGGLALRLLPEPGTVTDSPLGLADVRGVSIDDLLGRSQVETDLRSTSALIAGRRVLVTGGGGSIGSEVVRQVSRLGPASLVVLDHDETHLHDTIASLGLAPAVVPQPALCDIRDADALDRLLQRHRPHVLFHAAAHKHVPMLETHATEAVLTNVVGTANVVAAAERVGCTSLVLISTDKAVSPSSVMGASKRIAEHVVITAAQRTGRPWCAVRFGNVLGSRGSVVPTFARQIAEGGPLTVTDPRMTRYFMTIPEAVALVIQSAALSDGADLFMLDMGQPVRILDLARRMVRLAGRRLGEDVELRITGLRPGEKLHEQLSTPEEAAEPTAHAAVSRLHPVPLTPAELVEAVHRLRGRCETGDEEATAAELLLAARLVGTRASARDAPLPAQRPGPDAGPTTTGGVPWSP